MVVQACVTVEAIFLRSDDIATRRSLPYIVVKTLPSLSFAPLADAGPLRRVRSRT